MAITINVSIDDKEVKKTLELLRRRVGNLRPAMKAIGETVRTSVIKNFTAEGRPDKWTRLSPVTLGLAWSMKGKKTHVKSGKRETKAFSKYKSGKKILTDSADLRNSITAKAYDDRVEIGTNVRYAAIHQFGGKAGRGRKVNIPARPFLMVQNEDWSVINGIKGT